MKYKNIFDRKTVKAACLILAVSVSFGKEKSKDYTSVGVGKSTATRPEKAFYNHTTNNNWIAVTNYGSYGDPNSPSTGRPSAQWPGGSGNNYIYDAGLWIGTEIGGQPAVTTYFYNPDQEWLPTVGFPGELGSQVNGESAKSIEDSYVVFDDIDERPESNHIPIGLKIFQRGLTWSLPTYDDFIVFEYKIVNTGLNGDLEDVFVSFWYDIDVSSSDDTEPHIDDLVDYEGWDGVDSNTDLMDVVDPMDLDNDGLTGYDEYGVPYLKDQPQNPNYNPAKGEQDGFYDEWALILDPAGDTLQWQADVDDLDRVAGENAVLADGTVLIGYLYPRIMSYIYDGDNPGSSTNDYGEREKSPTNEGFIGGQIIYTDAGKQITAGDGKNYMAGYSHQWWNWESDPGTDKDKLDYIKGRHSASQGKKFLNNPLELGYPQFDYRFLLSTGPFDIPENDTIKVVFAIVCGTGLRDLRANAENAVIAYYSGSDCTPMDPCDFDQGSHWALPIPPSVPLLSYSPISGGMNLVWDSSSESFFDDAQGVNDFKGYQIYRATYGPQDWDLIAAFEKSNSRAGTYVVHINGDTLNQKDSDGNWILTALPDITNTFSDTGFVTVWGDTVSAPVYGLPYYYCVSAYDSGHPDAGLAPAYSPLSNYNKSVGNAPIPVFTKNLYEAGDIQPELSAVLVVPNPYLGTAKWEAQYEDRIMFKNLPGLCKISIFSLSGDLVDEIAHSDGSDIEYWDLISRNNQSVVSGLYIFVVEDGKSKHVGKFSIFR